MRRCRGHQVGHDVHLGGCGGHAGGEGSLQAGSCAPVGTCTCCENSAASLLQRLRTPRWWLVAPARPDREQDHFPPCSTGRTAAQQAAQNCAAAPSAKAMPCTTTARGDAQATGRAGRPSPTFHALPTTLAAPGMPGVAAARLCMARQAQAAARVGGDCIIACGQRAGRARVHLPCRARVRHAQA